MSGDDVLNIARRWADALDRDDFEALPAFLSPECRYHSPGGEIVGPEAIIASYESSSVWAHATFDRITWASECEGQGDDRVLITFIDIADHRGEHHVYRCQQLIHVDDAGLIDDIIHISIEGEETALADFFARIGVTRPT